jgi:hypothetical protein
MGDGTQSNLTILLALLPALLTTTTTLLTALTSGHLLLLAGLLLAALLATLLAGLLAALLATLLAGLLAALLLPALLHIAHFVVGHGEFSSAEGFRATTIFLRLPWFRERTNAVGRNAGTTMRGARIIGTRV